MDVNSCRSLNSTSLLTNTSDTSDGVIVRVSCMSGYKLFALHTQADQRQDVFQCMESHWFPSIPRCIAVSNETPLAVIVGCTVGAVVCVAIILVAAYMLFRTRNEGKEEKQNDMLQKAKMQHLDFFMSSFQQDNVGMPAVTADSTDVVLRGVTSSCTDTSACTYDDLLDSASQTNGSMSMEGAGERRGSIESITSAGDLEEHAAYNQKE